MQQYHQKASYSSKIFLLKRLFRTILVENGNMEDHISEILDLVNKLAALGKTMKDNLIAAILLSSLPDSYSVLITGLESRKEDLTLELVKGKLIDEYMRRQCSKAENNESEAAIKVGTKKVEKF